MLLLCLDTSTSAVSVALHDGTRAIAQDTTIDPRRHAELLAPAIGAVLDRSSHHAAEVTAVVCGVGPGPYTGLRVGLATARVFGYAIDVPVLGVCSLDVLAWQAFSPGDLTGPILVATDARRKEVYWAVYEQDSGDVVRRDEPVVERAADLPREVRALPTVGRGPRLWPAELANPLGHLDVSAAALGSLAARRLQLGGELLDPEPLYLRRPDATPPGAAKAVS